MGDSPQQQVAEDKQDVVVAEGLPHLLEVVVEVDAIVVEEPDCADMVD